MPARLMSCRTLAVLASSHLQRGEAYEALRDELARVREIFERRDLQIAPLAEHHLWPQPRGDERGRVVAERAVAGGVTRAEQQIALEDLWSLRGPETLARYLFQRRTGLIRAPHRIGE